MFVLHYILQSLIFSIILYCTRNQKSLQAGWCMPDSPLLTVTMPFNRIALGSGNQTIVHVSSFEVCLEYQWSSTMMLLKRYLNLRHHVILTKTWSTSVMNQDNAYIDLVMQRAKSGQYSVKGSVALTRWVFRCFYVNCMSKDMLNWYPQKDIGVDKLYPQNNRQTIHDI